MLGEDNNELCVEDTDMIPLLDRKESHIYQINPYSVKVSPLANYSCLLF